jgi:uncharacterized protein YyaL (SSP411 family)
LPFPTRLRRFAGQFVAAKTGFRREKQSMAEKTRVPAPARANRLGSETSPYLRQHAHNPVDWYAWGPEALDKARQLDRPIFLSIGYSACHWCHVMAHESFEDEAIADVMNRYFINVKVDREERPDLDQIYMSAVTALSGHGGWPMSVFLTPDLEPFFGGTYWPPEARRGMPGFREVLEKVHEAWVDRRDDVRRGAAGLTEAVRQLSRPQSEPGSLDEDLLRIAQQERLRTHDPVHGGFGGAPKFPHPMDLRLLLRTWKRFGDREALDAVRLTLDKMSAGGIYDHLGGGFHRYSTDARWLVPHFEKMLYDNALLTSAYLEAFQATGDESYARVARETLDYVLREMTHPDGGFYSTQDADSEGEEGKFFVWTEDEVRSVLGEADARVFSCCYDVTAQGNWEEVNILNRVKTHAQAARVLGLSEDELAEILARGRAKLFQARERRVHPGRDEKILASWNGFMIAATAQAASVLGEARYAAAAARAADFLLERLRTPAGRLLHTLKDQGPPPGAYLDDYAAAIEALVDVYQATFEGRYVEAAVSLADDLIARFADAQAGGFFYTAADHEALIVRTKDVHDSATPSGNGLAAFALARLARLSGRQEFDESARRTLEMLSGEMRRVSMGAGQALLAFDDLLGPSYEIVIVDGGAPAEAEAALRFLHGRFVPNKIVARRKAGHEADRTGPLAGLLGDKTAPQGCATLYVCERGVCRAPVSGLGAIEQTLSDL